MKRTPFYQWHIDHGGKMVDFAGWEMPIRFGSIIDEHNAVRNVGGMFDVSHMGRVYFKGRHARRFLERMLTRRISDMKEKTCRYSMVCNESGGVLDDVIVYRFDGEWMLVVNASNREKLLAHFEMHRGDLSVKIDDRTEKTGMIALQGPKVMDFIGAFSKEIPTLKRYTFAIKNLLILKMVVSRTGYTGENGVEVILPSNMVGMALKLLMKEDPDGNLQMQTCGLGARDTLRLEAGMPLYGHELNEEIDPLSAGLNFAVSLDKVDDTDPDREEAFVGQKALQAIAENGPTQKLVGIKLDGRRTPRQGATVSVSGETVGTVTSGCLSPTLGVPIAMAYVSAGNTEIGTALDVEVGKATSPGTIVALPFYKSA